jgi:hypothetical protein
MTNTGWPSMGHNNPPSEVVVETTDALVETPEEFIARRDKEIQTWLDAKPVLETAKSVESEARAAVTKTLFPEARKGTQRYNLNGGYKIKLVYGLTYTLGDKDKVDHEGKKVSIESQIRAVEEKIAELGPEAELLVERLIKWKPELSGSEYEKLDSNSPVQLAVRNLIDEVLTIKPASPQLTFEEPKAS